MRATAFVFGVCLLSLTACAPPPPPTAPPPTNQSEESQQLTTPPKEVVTDPHAPDDVPVDNTPVPESYKYTPRPETSTAPAHQKYLADPFVLQPLEDGGLTEKTTAVIGSHVAQFYPLSVEDTLKAAAEVVINYKQIPKDPNGQIQKNWTMDELQSLPEGKPIPFGTILPLLPNGVISGPMYNLFPFQGHYNRFYKTRFEGVEGYVFGADLYGLGKSRVENMTVSELYLTQGKPTAFHAVVGLSALPLPVTKRLAATRLAFQATELHRDYGLSSESPDDLVSSYKGLATYYGDRQRTVFLTTDLAAHAQHLVFDRILQFEEETYFAPKLKTLLADIQAKVAEWKKANPKADPWPATLARRYLQVAQLALDLAPQVETKEAEYNRTTTVYTPVDPQPILKRYPAEVVQDLDKMQKASGFGVSAALSKDSSAPYREDFSQYRPRGHYTKNGVLSTYFQAMMWLGRVHFLIAKAGPAPLPDAQGTSGDSTTLTLNMEPTALLLTDLMMKNADLYREWSDLFDPITALIGLADDLTFPEVMPLWKAQNVSDFGGWASSKDNLLAFMEKAHQTLRPPAISGNSVFWGPSEGADHSPPMGWRLFGQRFTWDSFVHEQVSPPRLMSRDMVRGLDIMKAFGSQTADALLAASDYPKMGGLEARLNQIAPVFARWTDDDWNKTYYNQTLFTVKAQATFGPGTGFYFTESPAWGLKAMISSHGTWAELRHDTILYVKQVYAERAGDGDFDPTFRIDPLPKPIHYIEPNLPFWKGLETSVRGLRTILEKYQVLDDEGRTALKGLEALYDRAVTIVQTEVADGQVSRQDLDWIPTFAGELVPLVLVHNKLGNVVDEDQLKMALIADVYTNAESAQVLEVGVGTPLRIFVPLNDGQGGKRIAVGYTFSYYEFPHPMGDRMTDEAWKTAVYPNGAGVTDKLPFWEENVILPPTAPGKQ